MHSADNAGVVLDAATFPESKYVAIAPSLPAPAWGIFSFFVFFFFLPRKTCLHAAARGGNAQVVQHLLLMHGCDPMQGDMFGVLPVKTAVAEWNLAVAVMLTQQHDLRNRFFSLHDVALHAAARPVARHLLLSALRRGCWLPRHLWNSVFAFWRNRDCCWTTK